MAVEDLLNTLRSGVPDDPDAEWRAAIALGTAQGVDRTAATVGLIEILSSGQAHALTRSHAVEALGRLADPQAIPTLTNALSDPYRLVRAYAAGALGRIANSEEAVTRLLERLQDDYFGVRAEAAAAAVNVAVRNGDAALRGRVREALNARRAQEQAVSQSGTERVLTEIDRSLAKLGV
jgi:HEAT repeat protein